MLNDNAKKWVESLRSGEFKQAQGRLNFHNTAYCCLGVACEIAIQNGVDVTKSTLGGEILYDGSNIVLPPSVINWLNLNSACGNFYQQDENKQFQLSVLNDNGMSFKEIADIIESEPAGLFKEQI